MRTSSMVLLALSQTALAQLALAAPASPETQAVPSGGASSEAVTDGRLAYQYSRYEEDDLKAGQSASGEAVRRFRIDTHHFRLEQPVFGRQALSVDLRHETLSGASPWYVSRDPLSGKPLQVMSRASIREERNAIDVGWTLALDRLTELKLSAGHSREDDYRSWSAGIEGRIDNATRMTTLAVGAGYSRDAIEPTQGVHPVATDSESRRSVSLYASLSQVISVNTQVQFGLSGQWQQGYLSDPYKLSCILVASGTPGLFDTCGSLVADSRPDARRSLAVTARLRHHLGLPGLALHLDYRYFEDDWEIASHALTLGLHRAINRWYLSADLRWYAQSQAGFYAPYYAAVRNDGLASSDYRLSPYGAIGATVEISRRINDWTLSAGLGAYRADASLAPSSVEVENPGLVSYLDGHVRLSRHY